MGGTRRRWHSHAHAGSPPVPPTAAGKAAWIAGTSCLILLIPLIIEMDREQQVRAHVLVGLVLQPIPSCRPVGPHPWAAVHNCSSLLAGSFWCQACCSPQFAVCMTPCIPGPLCLLQLVQFESEQLNAQTGPSPLCPATDPLCCCARLQMQLVEFESQQLNALTGPSKS